MKERKEKKKELRKQIKESRKEFLSDKSELLTFANLLCLYFNFINQSKTEDYNSVERQSEQFCVNYKLQ
jgi:uncharacterized protein (UPF0305 family)